MLSHDVFAVSRVREDEDEVQLSSEGTRIGERNRTRARSTLRPSIVYSGHELEEHGGVARGRDPCSIQRPGAVAGRKNVRI